MRRGKGPIGEMMIRGRGAEYEPRKGKTETYCSGGDEERKGRSEER